MADEEEEKKVGGGNTLKIIIAAVVLIIIAAAVYLLVFKEDPDAEAEGIVEEVVIAPPPIFVKVGPMTVNLVNERLGPQLLYTSLTLKVANSATEEILNVHMPEVHSRILLLLSSKKASELTTPEGKTILAEQVLATLNIPLTEPQTDFGIDSVLFTDFIVQ